MTFTGSALCSDLSTRTSCGARLLFILDRVYFEIRAVYVNEDSCACFDRYNYCILLWCILLYYRHCFLNSEEQASGNILRILYDAIHFASHPAT